MKFTQRTWWLAALSLAACDGNTVKDQLGLYRSAPDEYTVVSRPPLSVPPQFGLRPPSATASSPNEQPASDQAASLVLGGAGKPDTAVTPVTASPVVKAKAGKVAPASGADAQFLKKAGADQADPNVREALVEEKYQQIEKKASEGWMDKLDWTSNSKDPMVDAAKEAERIQRNSDGGKPVTEGETPQVKGRDKGLLGDILDY